MSDEISRESIERMSDNELHSLNDILGMLISQRAEQGGNIEVLLNEVILLSEEIERRKMK